ncbi:MAG TPA: S9 family peptidase, partial [Erythrobacter sp.]|nr:S9 family peptidase [Erythrobacter sp.]
MAYFGAIELEKAGGVASTNMIWKHGRRYLYGVDTRENQPTRVATAAREGVSRDWLLDARGEVAAMMDVSADDGDWRLAGPQGDVIASGNERNGRVGLVGLGYDGTT